MKGFSREETRFSLCGLNCLLCSMLRVWSRAVKKRCAVSSKNFIRIPAVTIGASRKTGAFFTIPVENPVERVDKSI